MPESTPADSTECTANDDATNNEEDCVDNTEQEQQQQEQVAFDDDDDDDDEDDDCDSSRERGRFRSERSEAAPVKSSSSSSSQAIPDTLGVEKICAKRILSFVCAICRILLSCS